MDSGGFTLNAGVNPYALADRRQRLARRKVEGLPGVLAGLLPFVAAVAALPLLRGSFYAFLDGSEAFFVAGTGGIVTRIGLALAAGLALTTYTEVVRGPDRGIIDLHPLFPRAWLIARTRSIGAARLGWLGLALLFLVPLWPRIDALAVCAAVLAGAWAAGIGAALGVNLVAPRLAVEPSLAGVFDAIRGQNPRLQAALIYAPGVALAVSGSATVIASSGATAVLQGDARGLLAVAVPFGIAVGGWVVAARNARAMEALPALLGEIDAAWASAEAVDEARVVYLEWAVRWVPAAWRRDLQKDLRHLWRGLRSWVSGSWGLAALAALAGWSAEADARPRLAWVGGAGLLVLGFAGVRLAATDPEWLDAMLPARTRVIARIVAIFLMMQVVVLGGAAALGVRHGWSAVAILARLEGYAALFAALGAVAGLRLRGRGGVLYVPVGIVLWAMGGTW